MFVTMKPVSEVLNIDCLEYMKSLPDNHFDLCIADPPYGICINESIGRRKGDAHSGRKKALWDKEPPSEEVFNHIFRISRNVVIWGQTTLLADCQNRMQDVGFCGIKNLAIKFLFHSLKWLGLHLMA